MGTVFLFLGGCQKEEGNLVNKRSPEQELFFNNSAYIQKTFPNIIGKTNVEKRDLQFEERLETIKAKLRVLDNSHGVISKIISDYGMVFWDRYVEASQVSPNIEYAYYFPLLHSQNELVNGYLLVKSIGNNSFNFFIINEIQIANLIFDDNLNPDLIQHLTIFTKFNSDIFNKTRKIYDAGLRYFIDNNNVMTTPRSGCWVYTVTETKISKDPGYFAYLEYPDETAQERFDRLFLNPSQNYHWVPATYNIITIYGSVWDPDCGENGANDSWINPQGGTGGGINTTYITDIEKTEAKNWHIIQMAVNPDYVNLTNKYKECGRAYSGATKELVIDLFKKILNGNQVNNTSNLTQAQILGILQNGISSDISWGNNNLIEALTHGINLLAQNGVLTSLTGALKYVTTTAHKINKRIESLCLFNEISSIDKGFLNFKPEVRDNIMDFLMNCKTDSEELNLEIINFIIEYGKASSISKYTPIDFCSELAGLNEQELLTKLQVIKCLRSISNNSEKSSILDFYFNMTLIDPCTGQEIDKDATIQALCDSDNVSMEGLKDALEGVDYINLNDIPIDLTDCSKTPEQNIADFNKFMRDNGGCTRAGFQAALDTYLGISSVIDQNKPTLSSTRRICADVLRVTPHTGKPGTLVSGISGLQFSFSNPSTNIMLNFSFGNLLFDTSADLSNCSFSMSEAIAFAINSAVATMQNTINIDPSKPVKKNDLLILINTFLVSKIQECSPENSVRLGNASLRSDINSFECGGADFVPFNAESMIGC